MKNQPPTLEASLAIRHSFLVALGATHEQAYYELASLAHRKKFGQFFTPPDVARAMLAWVITPETRTLLDPATGTGIFLGLAKELCHEKALNLPALTAYDLDPDLLEIARLRLNNENAFYENADFLLSPPPASFDAVICNPPYLRHHDLTYNADFWQSFDQTFNLRLSRLTNSYSLFILQISRLLSATGRAAIITPGEYLNANFGREIKRYLLRENLLESLIWFDSKTLVFDNAITTACITLLRKGRSSNKVGFARVTSSAELAQAIQTPQIFYPVENLDANRKWRDYLPTITDIIQKSEIYHPKKANSLRPAMVPLATIADSMRGIATGANQFFTLSQSEAEKYAIEPQFLKLCVTKAHQIRYFDCTLEDFATLETNGKKMYLLHIPSDVELLDNLQKYLREGEKQNLHRRYLTSHRPKWYLTENRPPAPLLVNVFSRHQFKVAYNRAKAFNLTAYHCLYPKSDDENLPKALAAYLISENGQAQIQLHKRTYGDGLDKLEPRDLNYILVPDFTRFTFNNLYDISLEFDVLCRTSRQ